MPDEPTDSFRVATSDLLGASLTLRKDRFAQGPPDADELRRLDQFPTGSQVSFTWKKD